MKTSFQPQGDSRPSAGGLVATILAGAWQADPPELALADKDIECIAPLLVGSGAAALAWNRIARQLRLRENPAAASLQEAYRFLALEEMKKEASLRFIAKLFGKAGIELMIFKGWAAARYYAKPHLRPFGDFDLCPPPGCHAKAAELLRQHSIPRLGSLQHGTPQELGKFVLDCGPIGTVCQVDLHADLDKFRLAPLNTLFARAARVALGEHSIRVPTLEDHLRLAAVHFLLHGGHRPLWLCDIAAMLEDAPEDFRWDLCFGDDARTGHWIACVFELAHDLLGARIDHVPPQYRVYRPPPWLGRMVLKEWQVRFSARHGRPPYLWAARPWTIPGELKLRWPNPIEATVTFGGAFGDRPRLRYQVAGFATCVARALLRRLRPAERKDVSGGADATPSSKSVAV